MREVVQAGRRRARRRRGRWSSRLRPTRYLGPQSLHESAHLFRNSAQPLFCPRALTLESANVLPEWGTAGHLLLCFGRRTPPFSLSLGPSLGPTSALCLPSVPSKSPIFLPRWPLCGDPTLQPRRRTHGPAALAAAVEAVARRSCCAAWSGGGSILSRTRRSWVRGGCDLCLYKGALLERDPGSCLRTCFCTRTHVCVCACVCARRTFWRGDRALLGRCATAT